MPKCLMNSVRGYRTRTFMKDTDPNVMTTRSGLAIKKISTLPVFSRAWKPSLSSEERDRKQRTNPTKYQPSKQKSMSYLPFVTRFYLSLRLPDLDLVEIDTSEPGDEKWWSPYFNQKANDSDSEEIFVDDVESSDECSDCERVILDNKTVNEIPDDAPSHQQSQSELCRQRVDVSDFEFQALKKKMHEKVMESSDTSPSPTHTVANDISNLHLTSPVSTSTATSTLPVQPIQSAIVFQVKPKQSELAPFKCEVCLKEFFLHTNYTVHLKTHTKQNNKCDICGKMFTRSWLLKGHMRTHTGERPFQCPKEDCDKAFADKSNLRSHMMIHSVTTKNFSCEKCGRAFAQKRYLHKHLLEVCRIIR